MELDVSFVCQAGEIEAMACMLAASLRRHHGNELHLHVIEPIPHSEYGTISEQGRRFLDGMGVRWYQRENPVSHEFKLFNKLTAFDIEPQTGNILFLDSDILIRGRIDELQAYLGSGFAARTENQQRFSGSPEAWKAAYGLFGLPVPEARWPTIDTSEWGPPYFNAGVMLVDSSISFYDVWSDTCRRIFEADEVWQLSNRQHRGTVQIGLPVAIARLGLDYELLPGSLHVFINRAMRRQRLNWPESLAPVVHYNEWTHVLRDERLNHEVGRIIRDFKLEPIFEAAPETAAFLEALSSRENETSRSVLLESSIIQAGAVIRDSSEEPATFTAGPTVLVMPGAGVDVHAGDNARVLDGAQAVPSILGLAASLKTHPDHPVVLLIDEPVASISRWRTMPEFWDGAIADSALAEYSEVSGHLRTRLAALRGVDDVALRRAGLWELLAFAANQPSPSLRIVRRSDVVAAPDAVRRELEAWCGASIELTVLPEVVPVSDAEAKAIRNVCAYISGAFGLGTHSE